ncbi:uncharacterized protein LOC118416114 [Branchiostoma floridae]|uniref:Uncharacterized protein LOC118416114 n=1 Tax=Branchiostoma floridae TaxID=7739 RepID=A0A9J7L7Q9_BRAFL|nr:uncharacterized protein LOC118416114 [Branchiostoma floridae]
MRTVLAQVSAKLQSERICSRTFLWPHFMVRLCLVPIHTIGEPHLESQSFENTLNKESKSATMAKPICMSLVWLIVMVTCLSFTLVKADGFKKKEAFEDFFEEAAEVLDVEKEVYNFYSRVLPEYEKWKKGEISYEEFMWKVGKAVVMCGCSMGGKVVGATIGAFVPIPQGKRLGAKIGGKMGELVCDAVIELIVTLLTPATSCYKLIA